MSKNQDDQRRRCGGEEDASWRHVKVEGLLLTLPYSYYYTNLRPELRARTTCSVRLRLRVKEHFDDDWKSVVIVSSLQNGIVAHAVQAEYAEDMRKLKENAERFVDSVYGIARDERWWQTVRGDGPLSGLYKTFRRLYYGPRKRADADWCIYPEQLEDACSNSSLQISAFSHNGLRRPQPPTIEIANLVSQARNLRVGEEFKKARDASLSFSSLCCKRLKKRMKQPPGALDDLGPGAPSDSGFADTLLLYYPGADDDVRVAEVG